MTKYNGSIQNLLQGVSQQPERERRPEQLSKQVNCLSSITRGLGKRPGTYFIDFLGDLEDFTGKSFYHYERGDKKEAYLFAIDDSGLSVFDLFTGGAKTVTTPDGVGYLAASDPETAFKFHTVADTTFLVNKEKKVLSGSPTNDIDWEVMIYCKQAQFGRTYKVIIDDVPIASYSTPSTVSLEATTTTTDSSTSSTDADDVTTTTGSSTGSTTQNTDKRTSLSTVDIITGLHPDLAAWATANGVTFQREGDVIWMYKASGSYDIQLQDGNNGNDLKYVKDKIAKYDDLPATARDNFKVKVLGTDRSDYNDYYVQFNSHGSSIGTGVWEECAGFNVDQELTASTMPHQIVREANGSFTLKEIEWVSRSAGDDDSNPLPSFVDNYIADVVTYQGRLVLTSEENQIASVTFDFFNFFSTSVLQESDDDPIDTASSDTQVTNLNHTLVFNSALVSFSDSAQFFHPGETAFTYKTFSLASKSKYPSFIKTKPVAAAQSIFFPYSFGKFSGVRELRFDDLTGNTVARPVTDHVREYINGEITQIEASPAYNKLFVRASVPGAVTSTGNNLVYVYEWYDRQDQRLQEAWGVWEFDADILYFGFTNNNLYLVMSQNDLVFLDKIDMSDQNSLDLDFPVRLDTMEYTGGVIVDDDTWSIPADTASIDSDSIVVIAADGTGKDGLLLDSYTSGGEIFINSDVIVSRYEDYFVRPVYNVEGYTEGREPYFWVGTPYEAEGVITNPYIRDADGTPITTEKLRLNFIEFNTASTGYIKLNLTKGASTFEKIYNSRVIDRTGLIVDGTPDIKDVNLRMSIRSDRDRCDIGFSSEHYTPFYVLDINWTGTYNTSGRRV